MQEILNKKDIDQKITRLAHQIIENTFEIEQLFIGGIKGNGEILAKEITKIIQGNSNQKITSFNISLNKNEPWSEPIELSIPQNTLKHGYILLVDDVLNSKKQCNMHLLNSLSRQPQL